MSKDERARLTTWLVDQRMQGVKLPEITAEVAEYAKAKPPLQIHERANRLLRFIAEQTRAVGKIYATRGPHLSAYAWSESTDEEEIHYFIDYLLKANLLVAQPGVATIQRGHYLIPVIVIVTVEGHSLIEQEETNKDSSQAFVAMWFHQSTDGAYREGIEQGIKEAGYKPLRIDRKEHINKIDDEIIAEIRRSRFLVADFTQGCDGARGGVYYEAGFARGLDLPVIYTCRKDMKHNLHLDTRQFNHIMWETYGELRESLKNRIRAVMGQGPETDGRP